MANKHECHFIQSSDWYFIDLKISWAEI